MFGDVLDTEDLEKSGQELKRKSSPKKSGASITHTSSEPYEDELKEALPSGQLDSLSSSTLSTIGFPILDQHRSLLANVLLEWLSKDETKLRNPAQLWGILKYKAFAVKSLMDIERLRLAIEQERDKRERLDAGKPTEILGSQKNFEDQIDSILSKIGSEDDDREIRVIKTVDTFQPDEGIAIGDGD